MNDDSIQDSFIAADTKTVITPMFELSGIHGRITLDNVYVNGLHALKQLNIRNLSDQPILVKMRSNLRNQIAFQLENENLINLPDTTKEVETTNTVAWSSQVANYPFNQLFNYVNHIDEIHLDARQCRSFILAFLPETTAFGYNQDMEDDYENSIPDESHLFSIFNVTGSLFFFGYYRSHLDKTTHHHSTPSLEDNHAKDVLSTSSLADSQISIKFRASVCRSMLWTDIAETGLNFDDCVQGETYYKDFIIQNRSGIDLFWLLNTNDLSNYGHKDWLQFVDASTKEYIESDSIRGYASKRIRVIFTPREVGEFSYDLQVENTNDSTNVIQTKIHATVRSVLRKETLIVSSGNIVDFGDCVSGAWAVQQIVLNNISESPLEVRFLPEGAEVNFDIKQDSSVTERDVGLDRMETRLNPLRRKFSRETGSYSRGINTPTMSFTSFSEMSAPNSEISSRSTSPTFSRGTDNEMINSPGVESSIASRLLSSQNRLTEELSDFSDYGSGIVTMDGTLQTDSNSIIDSTIPTSNANNVVPLNNTESFTRIEDFVLKPGTERMIQVSYRPQKDASINDFNAGQLIRRQFRICLEYGVLRAEEPKEKKVIQCRARTCTSFVEVIPKVINFGDTDVGTLKSLPIKIYNRSDITAHVELQFSSKVLNCLRGEIRIQPRNYVELKLDLYPRKVNPDYRKQITLVNFRNKDNDQIIEVHSNNIDKNRVTFHSLFYRILTATGANFLDFGSIALNSPSLRTFTVENIRDKPLSLEITTSLPDDIAIYTRNKNKTNDTFDSPSNTSSTLITTQSTFISPNVDTNESTYSQIIPNLNQEIPFNDNQVAKESPILSSGSSVSSKRLSKIILETISNRRISKPPVLTEPKKSISEAEATQLRRTTDAKKDLQAARKLRSSAQQLKIEQAHSSTAYLDLALPPVQSMKSSRKKMIQIRSDPNFLTKDSIHRKSHSRMIRLPEMKEFLPDKQKLEKNRSYQHKRKPSLSLTSKPNTQPVANGEHTKSSNENQTKRNGESTRNGRHGSRHTKSKRSMGITAARYKSRKNLDWSDIAGKARVPFEDLISVLEHGSKAAPPLFPKQSAEEQFVRYQLAWRRELDRLIEKGILVRTSVVDVDPKGEEEVVIVMTPTGATRRQFQSAPKKQDARIFLKLLQFDRDLEQTEFESLLDLDQENIPVREIILRSQLCQTVMDLGQKNINFGVVERNERHAKTIVLHNRSETPLLYAIRKSGSIASGDIDLDVGRYGVVRSYGKREVDFVFEPTLPGAFLEKLVIENIRDRTNDQVLLLKAQVRKPSTFVIKSLEIAFGRCLIDQTCCHPETIVLTNTNKQTKMFEIRVDPNEVVFGNYYAEFDFDVKDDDTNTISKEAEEEIENLEQKLKIAQRKGQPDKISKYMRRLAKLKNLEDAEDEVGDSSKKVEPASSTKFKPMLSTLYEKEGNVIFKKTAESVVFPLEAHASKTVYVSFRPVLRPIQSEEMVKTVYTTTLDPIHVKGRLLVHEYKNTDVCKSIVYTAEVFATEESFSEGVSAENNEGYVQTLLTGIKTAAAVIKNTMVPSSESSIPIVSDKKRRSTGSVVVDRCVQKVSDAKDTTDVTEYLKLERNFFDGGRIEINQTSEFYVRVTNESDECIQFDLVSQSEKQSVFQFASDIEKKLAPRETRKVRYRVLPVQEGRQQHTFYLKNLETDTLQPFTIECLVHRPVYLDFPSLADEANGVLDLGFSYVDPGSKYSQVTPLLVENTSDKDLFITCQSNLSHQVLIFMDESGERGLVEMMPLKGGGMTTVWVAVQPNLLRGYLGNSADECRELVGGIKFSIFEKDGSDYKDSEEDKILMLHQTVKFTSIIGQSHLEVSDKIINLGYTDLLHKEFYGAFTIKNKSGQLPLDYEVESLNSNVELDRKGGTLHGWRGTQERRGSEIGSIDTTYSSGERRNSFNDSGAVNPTSLSQITFRVTAYRYGLLNEKLIVTNKRNSQETFIIEVRLFVDCKKLDAWTLPSRQLLRTMHSHTNPSVQHLDEDHADHREASPLPLIKWESIYICPVSQYNEEESVLQMMDLPVQDSERLYVKEIDIANTSRQPMELIVMSDVDVTVGWVVEEDKVTMMHTEDGGLFKQRSGQLLLQPGQRVRASIHNPSADKLDEEERSLALQGKSGLLKGMLVIYDVREQLEVLALELEALFCVSQAELSVDRIDLGKIGYSTSYKPARFEFQVCNLADVPAIYDILAPEFIDFTPLDKNGVPLKLKNFYIPSRKTQRIEGLLNPKGMHDQSSGVHKMVVRIENLRNRSNIMQLQLKALMTTFELRFERLSAENELVLPTLHHPIALANSPCDNWFVIHNQTDDDIRFEVGTNVTPELEGFVYLDVLSRYTNSPLQGDIALGPQSSIEIRVRASPNESSRLPQDHSEFTNPNGIIMAQLWVNTLPMEEDEDEERANRVCEMIPIRCVLSETATFSLSEKRLDFRLVTYYQDIEKGANLIEAKCEPENRPLTVINHANKVPLRFKVTVEGPAEFNAHEIVKINGLNENNTGVIEGGETLTLYVSIINPKDSMPGQLKIHIDDLDGLKECRQTAIMYLTEIVRDL
ncbi:hypothetical protein BDB01DRAFT_800596 [Pilobolus umbonatus]|nr:hypothetical protein BDB01DRAFT_800596 [Pilobolus umbonatus]